MDYTELHNCIQDSIKHQGIQSDYLDRKETLYYDESGNIKHLIIKNGKLNASEDTVFVLGGIQAEEPMTQAELNLFMGKTSNKELKSTKDINGEFNDILRKENFKKILLLIQEKKYHIHFLAIQIFYYGIVDIIDSINDLNMNPFLLKSCLYNVLKKDPQKTIDFLRKYKYPNIQDDKKNEFIDELIKIIRESLVFTTAVQFYEDNLLKLYIICMLKIAKEQNKLYFIQDEPSHIWVQGFEHFYRQEILKYPYKTLLFDEEKQVQRILESETIEIHGNVITNFSFRNSCTEPMIQVSDYVVSIIRKYIIFLDRSEEEIQMDISKFDSIQMSNFKLFNEVLSNSYIYNPSFFSLVASCYTTNRFYNIIENATKANLEKISENTI